MYLFSIQICGTEDSEEQEKKTKIVEYIDRSGNVVPKRNIAKVVKYADIQVQFDGK